MINYCYICPICGKTKTGVSNSASELSQELPYYCPNCEECMVMKPEKGFRIGNEPYSKPLISDSLAIHPEQTAEHRKKFPDVDVLPDGRLRFNDYKSHDNYLKATGFQKTPQRIRKLKSG